MEKLQILLFISFFLILQQTLVAQKRTVDLIVQNGTVVTMDAQRRVIENGAVAVSKSEIVAVGSSAEIAQKYSSKQIVNARGKVVIPGLINAHTHIPMTLFRGIADDLDLQEWLTKYIFPAEAKNVTEDFVRVGTRLGLAEMIRGGTTTYCDMYYFEDAIADETFKAGVRGVLGETIIRFPVADNKTPEEALVYTERFINKWKNNALIVPALAPHAAYTLTTEHLNAVKKLADKLNATIVIHVAETQTEVDDISKQYGARPIEYLEKIGFLNNRTIAAHVVFANESELDIFKKKQVGIAHNPQSNMKLASGVAPVPMMLAKDMRLGLGTDGAASNNDLSMWEEMDTSAKLHKLFSKDPKVVSAEQAFMMATIGGARALHLEDKIGSIETGKRADIVIVDFDNVHQTPMYNVYSHLVYATKASDVRHVIINGKIVMRDRNLLTLNENVIKKDANLYREKIIKSLSNN
ncbi:MAG TPA: amidohydrolase [Pyrinomonadaceae bacterium]|jgi:5-methylthioadenosine/S-adenosylhomocysteine deaminase